MGCDRHDAQELPHALAGARVIRPIGFDAVAGGAVTLRPWEPADVSLRLRHVPRPGDPALDELAVAVQGRGRDRAAPPLDVLAGGGQGRALRDHVDRPGRAAGRRVGARCRPPAPAGLDRLLARARGSAPGAATDAVVALSDWALDALDLDEVYADVLRGNDASTRVLERCGYEARAEGSCTQRGLSLPSTRYVRRAG